MLAESMEEVALATISVTTSSVVKASGTNVGVILTSIGAVTSRSAGLEGTG